MCVHAAYTATVRRAGMLQCAQVNYANSARCNLSLFAYQITRVQRPSRSLLFAHYAALKVAAPF
jgi:hypothetical protein